MLSSPSFVAFACLAGLLLLASVPLSSAHECNGMIINDTNFTFVLSVNSLSHGSLSVIPSVQLLGYGVTKFQITSNFGLNDRIDYKWGYLLQSPDPCSNSSSTQVSGEFKYSYGSVSCSVGNAGCDDGGNVTVSYTQCSGLWNYSNPTFNIMYKPGSTAANEHGIVLGVAENAAATKRPANSPLRRRQQQQATLV